MTFGNHKPFCFSFTVVSNTTSVSVTNSDVTQIKNNKMIEIYWHNSGVVTINIPTPTRCFCNIIKGHNASWSLFLWLAESVIQPNLWLMVNPALACPLKYPVRAKKQSLPKLTIETNLPRKNLHLLSLPCKPVLDELVRDVSLSSEYQVRLYSAAIAF